MATREESINWRVPAQALLGGVLILLVDAAIAGLGLAWSIAGVGPGGRVSFTPVLLGVTIGLAVIAFLLLAWGLIRRRLGPMRLGALLSIAPVVITLVRPSDDFVILAAAAGVVLLGVVLVFTGKRPRSVIYR